MGRDGLDISNYVMKCIDQKKSYHILVSIVRECFNHKDNKFPANNAYGVNIRYTSKTFVFALNFKFSQKKKKIIFLLLEQ